MTLLTKNYPIDKAIFYIISHLNLYYVNNLYLITYLINFKFHVLLASRNTYLSLHNYDFTIHINSLYFWIYLRSFQKFHLHTHHRLNCLIFLLLLLFQLFKQYIMSLPSTNLIYIIQYGCYSNNYSQALLINAARINAFSHFPGLQTKILGLDFTQQLTQQAMDYYF